MLLASSGFRVSQYLGGSLSLSGSARIHRSGFRVSQYLRGSLSLSGSARIHNRHAAIGIVEVLTGLSSCFTPLAVHVHVHELYCTVLHVLEGGVR